MKKLVLMALAAGMAMSGSVAQAADKLTLQLKWVTQAQFAGYYVAQDRGFYEAEGWTTQGRSDAPAQVILAVVLMLFLTGCHRRWPHAKRV